MLERGTINIDFMLSMQELGFGDEPLSYKERLLWPDSSKWAEAEDQEWDAINSMGTFKWITYEEMYKINPHANVISVLRLPRSHLAPTGGWYRQVPTAHCHPAPPSWARGGGTGGLRRPKPGSVPGGLLGDAQGWETSGKTKIQDKEHTVAREWVGEHRPTGRGVKGAGAPSLKGEGRRPGKPDVGPGRAGFRVTSTCRESPVFTK